MEVKEEEAKICRLCGQTENLCIDVFSEDGTSRLLHLKIHSKINILIDERDPLPKTICVHCVGKLEFVCDFQEECLRTQQLLRDRYNLPPLSDVISEDDKLPTCVCIKCIGALEFLCDFYSWCHRTQQNLEKKVKRIHSESDGSQFSTDDSDKENALPPKKRKWKSKLIELAKKVSEPVQLLEPEIPEKIAIDKGSVQPSASPGKDVAISSSSEVLVPSQNEISISSEKEVSVPSRTEISDSSEKQLSDSFGKQLYVAVQKVPAVVKTASIVENTVPLTKEASVSLKPEIPNKEKDSKTPRTPKPKSNTDKNQKEETRRSGDNKSTTPLITWLNGDSMSKTRKVSDSSVHNKGKITRLSESKYGKLSELMTTEQKKTIENCYRVDMSVVDVIKVANNMTIHSRNEIECNICKQKYNRMDKCQVHIWRHLDMTPYFCSACKFSTLTVSNIRCHIRKSHLKIKPFECHVCQKKYTSSTALDEHINTHTGAKPHQCSMCSFSSSSRQILTNHYLTHKNLKDIICDVCGKSFYSKARLRNHKFIHIKDTAFKCKYCSTYFMQEEALNKHYDTAHAKDHECNICNKIYKSKKALNNHQNVHSEAKYQCTICPNRYKSQHILKEHLLKHKGIRKYKCTTCQKTFAQQSHLAAHMAVHIGIRYKCPGCEKGFNRHDNMKVHTKRCNEFISNPDLKDFFTKRVRTKTENIRSIETTMDNTSLSSIISTKTNLAVDKQIVAKVEPDINSDNSDEDFFLCAEEDDESEKSVDEELNMGRKISVTENILSPDCF